MGRGMLLMSSSRLFALAKLTFTFFPLLFIYFFFFFLFHFFLIALLSLPYTCLSDHGKFYYSGIGPNVLLNREGKERCEKKFLLFIIDFFSLS